MNYPLRIRFWYAVHNAAERLWHWVYYAKIQPWQCANEPPRSTTYTEVGRRPATEEEQARGITEHIVYSAPAQPLTDRPVPSTGSYSYRLGYVPAVPSREDAFVGYMDGSESLRPDTTPRES